MKFIAAWHFIHYTFLHYELKKKDLACKVLSNIRVVVTPIGFKPITF